MFNGKWKKLADIILNHSIDLKRGETVYIEAFDIPEKMIEILINKVYEKEANPILSIKNRRILRTIYKNATKQSMEKIGDIELYKIKQSDAYIGIKAPRNISEHIDIDEGQWNIYRKYWWKPAHLDWRVPKTKWVTLRWPTSAFAQKARMSTEAFENYYFKVCTMDYSKMSKAMDDLKELMESIDLVRIEGPNTELSFELEDTNVIKCDGRWNLPDGEIFTAPKKESVEGSISFNTPTIHYGRIFRNIQLEFENGRVIKADSSDSTSLNKILDTDEGARYVGEFGIGLNPHITSPITDIIFDEKIRGSIHLALGNPYREADNGNSSKIHWDLILRQMENGGKIYFDGELIRENGLFVKEELRKLNPSNLLEKEGD